METLEQLTKQRKELENIRKKLRKYDIYCDEINNKLLDIEDDIFKIVTGK